MTGIQIHEMFRLPVQRVNQTHGFRIDSGWAISIETAVDE